MTSRHVQTHNPKLPRAYLACAYLSIGARDEAVSLVRGIEVADLDAPLQTVPEFVALIESLPDSDTEHSKQQSPDGDPLHAAGGQDPSHRDQRPISAPTSDGE